MIAVAPLPGMPMVISGIMAPPTEAVAAVCGATMPSGMPVPISVAALAVLPLDAIGDERGDGGAGAGHDPDDDADQRAAHEASS